MERSQLQVDEIIVKQYFPDFVVHDGSMMGMV